MQPRLQHFLKAIITVIITILVSNHDDVRLHFVSPDYQLAQIIKTCIPTYIQTNLICTHIRSTCSRSGFFWSPHLGSHQVLKQFVRVYVRIQTHAHPPPQHPQEQRNKQDPISTPAKTQPPTPVTSAYYEHAEKNPNF